MRMARGSTKCDSTTKGGSNSNLRLEYQAKQNTRRHNYRIGKRTTFHARAGDALIYAASKLVQKYSHECGARA